MIGVFFFSGSGNLYKNQYPATLRHGQPRISSNDLQSNTLIEFRQESDVATIQVTLLSTSFLSSLSIISA
ncbi:replication protein RepA [Enterobacter sp. 10-1]|nr:replication protein RepA [Salmonella enterica]PAC07397.1 replication protein RepA [Enterobacter sp. 10-1]